MQTVETYKAQAKRLKEFLSQAGVGLKHAHALEAIAAIHGEKNFHILSRKAENQTEDRKKGETDSSEMVDDAWGLIYEQIDSEGHHLRHTLSILKGPADALGVMFHSSVSYLEEFNPHPKYWSLNVSPQNFPGSAIPACLEFFISHPARKLRVRIFPMEKNVMMYNSQATQPNPDILGILAKMKDAVDINTVYEAGKLSFGEFLKESHKFHDQHISHEVFDSVGEFLRGVATGKVTIEGEKLEQGKGDALVLPDIYTCDTQYLGKYRFCLKFITDPPGEKTAVGGKFYFDMFDETGRGASFIGLLSETLVRQRGNTVLVLSGSTTGEKTVLKDLPVESMKSLQDLSKKWGARFVDDKGTVVTPYHENTPEQTRFLEWLRKKTDKK